MQNILKFIYFGEVTLLQEQVDALLDVATELQIKDLRQKCTSVLSELYSDKKEREGYDPFALSDQNGQGGNEKGLEVDKESKQENTKYLCNLCDFNASSKGNLKIHQEFKHGSEVYKGVVYSCGQCDYQIKDRGTLSRHQKSKHEGIRYSCDLCDYQVMYKFALKHHKQSKHEGIRYSCVLCKYEGSNKASPICT